MSFIKNFFKRKIIKKYNSLSQSDLRNLKIIEKELLSLSLCRNEKINKSLQGYFYNFLIMPHFSKFYIFFNSLELPLIFPLPFKCMMFLKKRYQVFNNFVSAFFLSVHTICIIKKNLFCY